RVHSSVDVIAAGAGADRVRRPRVWDDGRADRNEFRIQVSSRRPDNTSAGVSQAGREMTAVMERLSRAAGAVLIAVVLAYQLVLRPLLVGACKFHPSCRPDAFEAIRRHAPLPGGERG